MVKNFRQGFTLIEVLVSITILLVVSASALAIFMAVISGQKIVLSGQETYGQLSYALEYMSKSLRMAGRDITGSCLDQAGLNYLLTQRDSQEGVYKGIKFINQSDNDACQEFYLDDSNPQATVIKEIKNSGNPVALTSDKIKIESFKFIINGNKANEPSYSSDTDHVQPRVTISMSAFLHGANGLPTQIQTTISQRNINIK